MIKQIIGQKSMNGANPIKYMITLIIYYHKYRATSGKALYIHYVKYRNFT